MNQPPPPPPSSSDPYGTPPPPPQSGNPYGTPPPAGAPGQTPMGVRPGELIDRFLARLIDGIGLGIVFGILWGIFAAIFISGYRSVGEALLFGIFFYVITTALYIGYYAFLESNQGATFGKQLLKLKVVGPDGVSNPTMDQALRRNAFYAVGLVSIVPIVGFFLGPLAVIGVYVFIAVTINSDTVARQGWHDKFAGGTRVLKIG
jgi:uncharacterized RDD family membrane protein YckC